MRAHRGAVFGDQPRGNADILPGRLVPVGLIEIDRGVPGLSVVEIGHIAVPLLGDLPALIGAEGLRCAVGIGHAQLEQQCLAFGRDAVLAREDERAHRPAAGHGGQQLVIGAQGVRHVVGLVLQLGFVGGKAGGKIAIAEARPVQAELIDANGRRIDPGRGNALCERQLLAEHHRQRRDLFFIKDIARIADPLGRPRRIQAPGLEMQSRLGLLALAVGDCQRSVVAGERLQGRSGIGDADLLGRLDAPRADAQHSLLQTDAFPVTLKRKGKARRLFIGNTARRQVFDGKAFDFQHVVIPPFKSTDPGWGTLLSYQYKMFSCFCKEI